MATTQAQVTEDASPEEYLALPYADAGIRIVAAVLDLIVLGSIFLLFVAASGFYLLSQTNWGSDSNYTNAEGWTALAILASSAFVIPIYFFTCWWWRGQSVGQMAVRIMVTDRDGYHLTVWQALRRTFLWPLSALPLGIGFLTMLFDRESRTLHDMLSGTVVLELP
jgi:Predicted membrane protein/domain